MSKRKASKETVAAFIKAVWPEMTELCMACNGEEEILKEATRLILSRESLIAAEREATADRVRASKKRFYRADAVGAVCYYADGPYIEIDDATAAILSQPKGETREEGAMKLYKFPGVRNVRLHAIDDTACATKCNKGIIPFGDWTQGDEPTCPHCRRILGIGKGK
jgi:hypothetical protein